MLLDDITLAWKDLEWALILTTIYFLIPLDYICKQFAVFKTKRIFPSIDAAVSVDILLFLTVVFILDSLILQGTTTPPVKDDDLEDLIEGYPFHIKVMFNTIYEVRKGMSLQRFDIQLSFLVAFVWLRIILYFRGFKQFGPKFRAIIAMIKDLMQFMMIWIVIIFAFACVATIIFGKLSTFSNLKNSLVYWYQASVGSWDLNAFKLPCTDCRQDYYDVGIIYTIIFLLLNVILLLNFVIAILGSTYGFFEEIKTGLFYNVLNAMCSTLEWDEHYGNLLCIRPPVPSYLFTLPFIPFYFILTGKALKNLNKIAFFVSFMPMVLATILIITALNVALIPIAYIATVGRLFVSLVTCQKNSATSFFLFLLLGLPLLIVSLFTNAYDFTKSVFLGTEEHFDVYKNFSIPLELFQQLNATCEEVLLTHGNIVEAKELVKGIQTKMNLIQIIFEMVFLGHISSTGNKED